MVTTSGTATGGRPMRADARRNYERLLAEAKTAFWEQGTDASLEEIARRAGVGIGTLYRHFPHRSALMDAVFRDEVDRLTALSAELTGADDPFDALATWLRAVLKHSSAYRGLAAALLETVREQNPNATMLACRIPLRAAGDALLERAQQAGVVRQDTDIADLLRLTNAIGLAADKAPEDPGLAERLLTITMDGVRARQG